MKITKGKTVVLFKKKQCRSGLVYGLQMKLIDKVANATIEMDTKRIFKMFCHTNMVDAKKAARKIGINVDNAAGYNQLSRMQIEQGKVEEDCKG